MALRPTTDADYETATRRLFIQVQFYFDGLPIVTFSSEDRLVDAHWTAEAPVLLGGAQLQPGRISLSLANDDLALSPSNDEGPYYGKIKEGLKFTVAMRPDFALCKIPGEAATGVQWDPIGTYYVTSWRADTDSGTVIIEAHDLLGKMFSKTLPLFFAQKETDSIAFMKNYILANLGYTETNWMLRYLELPYAIRGSDAREQMSSLLTDCYFTGYCLRDGDLWFKGYDSVVSEPLRKTFDDNTLFQANEVNSMHRSYDCATVTYSNYSEGEHGLLGMLSNQAVPLAWANFRFSLNTRLLTIAHTAIRSDKKVRIVSEDWDANGINIIAQSLTGNTETASLYAYGTQLDSTSINIGTITGDSVYSYRSDYLQNNTDASWMLDKLNQYVSCDDKVASFQWRGNPRIWVGDKIKIESSRFKIDFTGMISRLSCTFSGGLSCTTELSNVNMFLGG